MKEDAKSILMAIECLDKEPHLTATIKQLLYGVIDFSEDHPDRASVWLEKARIAICNLK